MILKKNHGCRGKCEKGPRNFFSPEQSELIRRIEVIEARIDALEGRSGRQIDILDNESISAMISNFNARIDALERIAKLEQQRNH